LRDRLPGGLALQGEGYRQRKIKPAFRRELLDVEGGLYK